MAADDSVFILVVEDDAATAAVIQAQLEGSTLARFSVQVADSLANALMALDLRRFDMIIVDLDLPDAFGLQALQTLVQHPAAVPCVVATASDNPELSQASIELGAQDFYVKGVSPPDSLPRQLLAARARHARLRRESERSAELLALFEDLPDGHLLIDDDDRVIVANRKAGELYGRESAWLVGQRFRAGLSPDREVELRIQPRGGAPPMTVAARVGFVRWLGRRVRVVALRPLFESVGAQFGNDGAAHEAPPSAVTGRVTGEDLG